MIEPREITEKFRLEKVIKSSRSGIVFRALDPERGATVTIKLIAPTASSDHAACQARFLTAMDALATEAPACFPQLLDHGFTPDASAFMVMSQVEGPRLDELHDISASRLLTLLANALDGLGSFATRGIPHGNLSPDNVFVTTTPLGERLCLVGFGTAAFREHSALGTAHALGSEASEYAAPERYDPSLGVSEPDWRGDIYSIALIVLHMLRSTFGPTDADAPAVELARTPQLDVKDPRALRALLEQCLRRAPAERT
jgi:serine/threonine protein kinase